MSVLKPVKPGTPRSWCAYAPLSKDLGLLGLSVPAPPLSRNMADNITQFVWTKIYERCVVDMQHKTTPSTLKYTNLSQLLAATDLPHSEAHRNLVLRMQQLGTKIASVLDIPLHHSTTFRLAHSSSTHTDSSQESTECLAQAYHCIVKLRFLARL